LAEGGQSYIYYAQDLLTGQPLVVKACKEHEKKKYLGMLKKEYEIMTEKLKGLDCIIHPLGFQNSLVNPSNHS